MWRDTQVSIDAVNVRWKALSGVLQAVTRVPGSVTAAAVVEHVIAASHHTLFPSGDASDPEPVMNIAVLLTPMAHSFRRRRGSRRA